MGIIIRDWKYMTVYRKKNILSYVCAIWVTYFNMNDVSNYTQCSVGQKNQKFKLKNMYLIFIFCSISDEPSKLHT